MALTHDPAYLRPFAQTMHVLLIQGIGTCWTDDASGWAWGSNIPGLTDRVCAPGLKVPDIRMGIDPTTGKLESRPVNFSIVDTDGGLATLFGTEPADANIEVLARSILPTQTTLTTIGVSGANGINLSYNPAGKQIGIEAIGTSGQRQRWSPFNFALPPLYHAADQAADSPQQRTLVTDIPFVFEGRLVALYRFFIEDRFGGFARFGAFADAELAWLGVMRDRGEIAADRTWRLSCYGPDGLLKRQLNATTVSYLQEETEGSRWFPIRSRNTLEAEQRDVAVFFSTRLATDPNNTTFFKSRAFASGDRFSDALSPSDLAAAIDVTVQAISDGTGTGYTHSSAGTAFTNDTSGDDGWNGAMFALGSIGIQSRRYTSSKRFAQMDIILHEKAWRLLGWDPTPELEGGQSVPGFDATKTTHVRFSRDKWVLSEWLAVNDGAGDLEIPEGYIVGSFVTIPISGAGANRPDNAGAMRVYNALYPGGVSSLDMSGQQEVVLPYDSPFVEGAIGAEPPDSSHNITFPCDRTRYWAVRGRMIPTGGTEAVDVVQVCKVSWTNADGHIETDSFAAPTLWIEKWLDPRPFGFNHQHIGKPDDPDNRDPVYEWRELEGGHSMTPLACPIHVPDDHVELRTHLLVSTLVSTGTASWSGTTLSEGTNALAETGELARCGDYQEAWLGLGIPVALVADPETIRDAFDLCPGGWRSPLQQVRHAWIGPVNSEGFLDSLTATVGIGWRLHGGQYGCFYLFRTPGRNDADLTIGETDLARVEGPTHGRKLLGQFNIAKLAYRRDPESGEMALAHREAALDRGARWRSGNLVHNIVDWGIMPTSWFGGSDRQQAITGVGGWVGTLNKLWAQDAASFFGGKNFTVSDLHIQPPKAYDCWPGTLLLLTNPWPLNPSSGTYGLTNVLARVLEVTRKANGIAVCTVLVYGQSLTTTTSPHWAPVLRLRGYDSVGLEAAVDADYPADGLGARQMEACIKPSWHGGAGLMKVRLYRHDRFQWTTGPAGFIESIDTATMRITFESPGLDGTYYRDSDYVAIPVGPADAQQADWCVDLFAPITLADGTYGASLQGKRFTDA